MTLETEPQKLLQSGNFIDKFAGTILRDIPDVNPEWAEACATTVLSTAIGPNKFTHTKIGDLHLNVWHLLVAPSGTSKTTALTYFVEPAVRALSDLVNETENATKDSKAEKSQVDLLLPRTFSLESLLVHMKKKGQAQGLITMDEIAGSFKEVASKSYAADLYENYSLLYDCQEIRATFVKWGAYSPIKNPYVTVIGAGTPTVYKYLPEDYSIQGTANRFLHIVGEEKSPSIPTSVHDYFGYDSDNGISEREAELDDFAKRLLTIRNSKATLVSFDTGDNSGTGSLMLEQYKRIVKEFEGTTNPFLQGYLHRLYEMTLKLAAIRALGAITEQNSSFYNDYTLTPMKADAEWAIEKAWRHYEHFKTFVKKWGGHGTTFKEAQVPSYAHTQDSIKDVIKARGGEATRSDLLLATRIKAKELDDILESMPEVAWKISESTGGNRARIYYLKEKTLS